MGKSIISNSSSLIFIGKLNIFDLVKNLYSPIIVPREVVQEIFRYDKVENLLIKREMELRFIKEIEVKNVRDFPIHVGERAAISLCIEKEIFLFLSDDKRARRCARSLGINSLGVIGIILQNYKLKHIDKNNVKVLIRKLIDSGFYMSIELYEKILKILE